ncbi:hypothetical protein [Rhodobacter sp. SY28-1]|jgi:hypothetical protein|uniref:hypothetical protein n=1 Tax=Rhodobacter sp. SY28-1 TaxID=2562317 RepID=UPI0010C0DFED|nr:hypothetical protein [Rhodobacter sp. SY28-1]
MSPRTRSVTAAAIVAVIFGLLTIFSGGRALFAGADMGAVVPLVLWFNFLAGFAYVVAGLGLWYRTSWATSLSIVIALATAAVFATFLWKVWSGTPYEARTMGAMGLRLATWVAISIVAVRGGQAR